MTPTDYALLAVAVVVLALLIVGWGKLVQQEIRSQRVKRDTPTPNFTYRFTGYDYAKAVSAKSKAKLLAKRKRQALDQRAIDTAKERRGEVVEMAAHRRIAR